MIFGTDNSVGLPLAYQYSFNGTVPTWGSITRRNNRIVSISPLNNSAESVDGAYQISDLEVSFADPDGSVWNTLGAGTDCLNKDIQFRCYFGGTAEFVPHVPGEYKLLPIENLIPTTAQNFALHTGKVTKVSKSERLVTIVSKSRMKLLGDLTWNYPYAGTGMGFSKLGSFYFISGDPFTNGDNGTYKSAKFNLGNSDDPFDVIARVATTAMNFGDLTAYFTTNRPNETFNPAGGFYYYGSQFAWDFPKVALSATYLTRFDGTVGNFANYASPTGTEVDDANIKARELGYVDYVTANAAKVTNGAATFIPVYRTRLEVKSGSLVGSTFIFQQGQMEINGNPATIYREMLAGAYVWPYFGTTDIDTDTFNDFQKAVTFMDFKCKLDPTETNVIDTFKNFIQSTFSSFAISESDKFLIIPYAPRNLIQSAPDLQPKDIIKSDAESNIEDLKNRVEINYAFDPTSGSYLLTQGTRNSSWTHDNDLLLNIQSKFIFNYNEAYTLMLRQIKRYAHGLNKYTFTLPLNRLGVKLGSIYTVTDTDTGLATKAVQIMNYQKDLDKGNTVQVMTYDAESLYQRKGFFYWGHGTNQPPGTGAGTDTFIWGTAYPPNVQSHLPPGTAHGINETLFGSYFSWW